MNRGNRRTTIFQDDEDYQTFLFFLTVAQEKFPFFLISYCLMTNHIHLQIETITHQPGKIMQYTSTNYANYYNNKYGYIGHLFQGRYQGEIIDNDAYMLQTSRYIHLNPVKAKIVEKPGDYRWSSYCVFIVKLVRCAPSLGCQRNLRKSSKILRADPHKFQNNTITY